MNLIRMTEDGLSVPDTPVIPFIEGDGIGSEIMTAVRTIVDRSVELAYGGKRKILWKEVLAGHKAMDKVGTPLPQETIDDIETHLVALKGPLETPVGGGMRSLNVALRQQLDLYVCQRPVKWFEGVSSPVKAPEKVDMCVFRENTEDIYAGIEWSYETPEAKKLLNFLVSEMGVKKIRFPETSSFGIKPVSLEGSKRLVRAAIKYAIENNLPSVTLVHKGNIMKFTEGGFKRWGYEVAEEEFRDRVVLQKEVDAVRKAGGPEAAKRFLEEAQEAGNVLIKDCICDAFLQNTLLSPDSFSVIATLNLNGDYVSDQLAAMVGGIGISPGANINYGTGHAIFEATHGTAPDIAGQNKANPSSLLLSAAMMLEYLGWNEASENIKQALTSCFCQGLATADLARFMQNGKPLGTSEFSGEVLSHMTNRG